MAAVTICSDFGAPRTKVSHCFHCFLIYLPWSDGAGCHDLSFWMLSFKPAFLLSSFMLIKRFFSSSSFSAFRVISSAYLRLLISLLAILILPCDSSTPAFCMMYSAYNFNKQGTIYSLDVLLSKHGLMSGSNYCLLTCIQILRRQARWSGIPISWRISYSLLWSTQSKALA